MPTILIVAGPNGAGKTTFAVSWLGREDAGFEFVNADEVARGLGDVAMTAGERDLKAGRLMLQRLEMLLDRGAGIVLETTLSSGLYARRIPGWRSRGYRVELIYLQLPSVDVSIARVALRVSEGGHGVPEPDLRRRFGRSLANLEVYKPLVDMWQVWESRDGTFILAERSAT